MIEIQKGMIEREMAIKTMIVMKNMIKMIKEEEINIQGRKIENILHQVNQDLHHQCQFQFLNQILHQKAQKNNNDIDQKIMIIWYYW